MKREIKDKQVLAVLNDSTIPGWEKMRRICNILKARKIKQSTLPIEKKGDEDGQDT